jgi:uncharacterized membrane protein
VEPMSPSARRIAVLTALVFATAFDLAILATRTVVRGDAYGFLAKNLVLAWIPLLLSLLIYDRFRKRGLRGRDVPLAFAWLLFFPNAPYLMTDFIHLRTIHDAPRWFDIVMLASFAITGVVLGLVSLVLLHAVMQGAAGRAAAWCFAGTALALCSVGVYLGRFVRFNSWSPLTEPARVLDVTFYRLANPLGNPLLLEVVLLFTGVLALGYFLVWTLARPTVELEPHRRS